MDKRVFTDIQKVNFVSPTITTWNRLEGRPRKEDFDRALKAEIRDALWMISKQWQMGEFIGDDAGSPVLAKSNISYTSLNKYQAGEDTVTGFDKNIPLEVKVENQKIPFKLGNQDISLDLRLLMGRQWLKMVGKLNPILKKGYLAMDAYKIELPKPSKISDSGVCAHIEVWQTFRAVANRRVDGYKFYQYLKKDNSNLASDNLDPIIIEGIDTEELIENLNRKGEDFVKWFENLYTQPIDTENPSWKPSYLEHQFNCSAQQDDLEKVLFADEYYQGHLDWYNFDIDNRKLSLGEFQEQPEVSETENSVTQTFIPSSVVFGGMPHPRWWKFENWKTNLSFINPDKPDINKLLVLDFALLYSNDWFSFPFTLPLGSIANIKGLMVKNVFGENIWVQAAGTGSDEDWQRWSMYNLNIRGTEDIPADSSLMLPPVTQKVHESKPLEEVYLIRDEIANMVWGVESLVPMASGKSKPGKEAGLELFSKFQQIKDEEFYNYELNRLSFDNVNDVPNTGESLVILAEIGQGDNLYIIVRIFDDKGEKYIDTSEGDFSDKAEEIENLKSLLKQLRGQESIPASYNKTLLNCVKELIDVTIEYKANIRYQIVNSVPEQWIPFIPVHIDENQRQTQLQRATMPRILENDKSIPQKIEPKTSLLRHGLDLEAKQPYFIHEEEIPRAGIKIYKSFQRTRWFNGKVYTWLGIKKHIGRGGGRSGLAFDQILPTNG